MAVSRKVGPAVTRNRVKRRLRETFRQLRPTLPESVEVVVVARPACAKQPGAVLAEDFRRLLLKQDTARGSAVSGKG